MRTARDAAVTLARRYSFGDVAALVAAGAVPLDDDAAVRVARLCVFGQRLLDLDAEDFGVEEPLADGSAAVPDALLARARACRMPQEPHETPRGALDSLRPAYRLLLEVIAARWERREMAALVAVVHIAAEYLPLLAWEMVLGHAGDPVRLPGSVNGAGSRFGDPHAAHCAHRRNDTSAANRALRVAREPGPGWRAYLDRQHSHVAHALGVCAADCRDRCTVMTRLPADTATALAVRCELALATSDSALVRLRHAAPVGHGFGVPSPDEVRQAWLRTIESLSHHGLDLAGAAFPAPGLALLYSEIAGTELAPDTLVADTSAAVVALLDA